jgi:hypothetical protein
LGIPQICGSDLNSIGPVIHCDFVSSAVKIDYYEAYLEQADALGREKYLKSGADRRFL